MAHAFTPAGSDYLVLSVLLLDLPVEVISPTRLYIIDGSVRQAIPCNHQPQDDGTNIMTAITSHEEVKRFLEQFTFETIGFNQVQESEHFIAYYKIYRHRDDIYVKLHRRTFEAELYTRKEESGQGQTKIGTFNIRRPDELLFMLTCCLNELRVEQKILARCKEEMGYDQTNIVPARSCMV